MQRFVTLFTALFVQVSKPLIEISLAEFVTLIVRIYVFILIDSMFKVKVMFGCIMSL